MEEQDFLTIYQIATELDLSLSKTKSVLKNYAAYIPFKKMGRSVAYPLSALKLILKIHKLTLKHKNPLKIEEAFKKEEILIINEIPKKDLVKTLPLVKRIQILEKAAASDSAKVSPPVDVLKEIKEIKGQLEDLKKLKKEVERLKVLLEG
ncbi:hypothetical protein MJH12_04470 [bacterium]|nr:hypothetical protein [bacterium]